MTKLHVGPFDAAQLPGRLGALVSDARVFDLYGDRIPIDPERIILVPEGEAAKSWDGLHDVLTRLAKLDLDRGEAVVALGGGSVGDLAGLAASLFKRGCPLVMVPTTLLAMADSGLGGKTAIDFADAKNLVGSFHAPVSLHADPSVLTTLGARQLRAGLAEIVKYGLIDDADFFCWLEENGQAILAGDADARLRAIRHSLLAKGRIVEGDEEDRLGKRALLNLGHSFAHAIEAAAGLGNILHGEAVAIGLVQAFRFSAQQGLCPTEDANRVRDLVGNLGLPTTVNDAGVKGADLKGPMRADKKNEEGLNLILARGIGQAFFARNVDENALLRFLA